MRDPSPQLTVDEAMADFQALVRDLLGDLGDSDAHGRAAPQTPEEIEAGYFRFAESILSLACPDPRLCTHQRCRRGGLCRHFADLHAVRDGKRKLPLSRRSPGATMVRYAVWVFMNSGRGSD